uniref:Ribosomal-protein-S18p-alanine acetyltransferase n=1 Tax=uncultured bacterium contig00038 TaxID=1181526 RepID=A0A806KJU3_9BACT|nr:ribosomal-protein-S18p-alanine acetyltransferase [uncultured bacterium contig00038]
MNHQHKMTILAPGSQIPEWAEKLEQSEFETLWGQVEEFEMLMLMDKCAFARWRVIEKANEAELLRIAVEVAQRRKGLAKRLMNECVTYLSSKGVKSFHLEVRASNEAARKLYESLGWRQIRTRKKYYRDGEDAVVYGFSR